MFLTKEVAERYMKRPSSVTLKDTTGITGEAARAIANYGKEIQLPKLKILTPGIAQALSKHRGRLALKGLTSLGGLTARYLSGHKDHLDLSGLEKLTEEEARALSKYDGCLVLDGIKKLNATVAKHLAKQEGELSLKGLEDVSANAKDELVKHSGYIDLPDQYISEIEDQKSHSQQSSATERMNDMVGKIREPVKIVRRSTPMPKYTDRVIKIEQSADPQPMQMYDLDILEWLSSPVIEYTFTMPADVTVLGEGPLNENDIINYLTSMGCKGWDSGCEWIIVGRDGFTLDELDDLIEEQWENEPKILSQELLFAAVISGQDPFTADKEILLKFVEGHPALEHLLHGGLLWPEVIEMEPLGEPQHGQTNADRVEHSPLNMMNYRVGKTNGLYPNQRHNILREAFETNSLPPVSTTAYMEEWGPARSRKRLWRIAHHLAWLAKFQKNNPNMEYAIADWVSDLEWLKRTYYRRSMSFRWPY